jgi:hypothetical protein
VPVLSIPCDGGIPRFGRVRAHAVDLVCGIARVAGRLRFQECICGVGRAVAGGVGATRIEMGGVGGGVVPGVRRYWDAVIVTASTPDCNK